MHRVNELFGKEVVNRDTGEKQATVEEPVFDDGTRGIVALVVKGGIFSGARVVRWSSISSVGDVVVVRGDVPFDKLGDDPEVADLRKRAHRVTGTEVVTEEGEKVGEVGDIFVDDRGAVVGYEVKQGLISGRKFLPAEDVRSTGKDAIIAKDTELGSIKDAERER